MTPNRHVKVVIVLLAISVMLETHGLAGLSRLGDGAYHGIHIALMLALVGSQVGLYLTAKPDEPYRDYALWFAVGLASTLIGDVINSAISGIEPASRKLSWGLLLFSIGYGVYCTVLWRHDREVRRANPVERPALRYLIVLPIIVVNLTSWFDHVAPNVRSSDLLDYGSFAFNLTIYVALPTLAFWYFMNTRWSVGGLLVFIGAVMLPYSDLVLFASWLDGGDPAVPARSLYAYNWILYFGGQCLVSLFPALVIAAGRPAADIEVELRRHTTDSASPAQAGGFDPGNSDRHTVT